MQTRHWLLIVALGLVPLSLLAGPSDEKGFVFVSGSEPRLRAEPSDSAKETGAPAVGGRLVYKKVVRAGDAIAWYFVEQPGLGSGWLSAANASPTRPTAPPAAQPVKRAPTPAPVAGATAQPPTLGSHSRLAKVSGAQTSGTRGLDKILSQAAVRGLDARGLSARGEQVAAESQRILQQATLDYITLERVIGIQMSDPPHPDGRYADVTARGRKADSEKFATTIQEGD